VDVRASGLAGHTDSTDDLTLAHLLTDRNIIDTHVTVNSLGAIRMADYHVSAVAAVVPTGARDYNLAVSRSEDRRAFLPPTIGLR